MYDDSHFIGQIIITAYQWEEHPDQKGFMLCDGRLLDATKYPALFALLGDRYGGRINPPEPIFALPDLRSADKDGKRYWDPNKPVYRICVDGKFPTRD
jgi:microcystin-dependent protein